MKSQRRALIVAPTLWLGILLCLSLIRSLGPAWATAAGVLTFENADIGTVAKQIGRLVGDVMKTHKGRAEATDVKRIAEELLKP